MLSDGTGVVSGQPSRAAIAVQVQYCGEGTMHVKCKFSCGVSQQGYLVKLTTSGQRADAEDASFSQGALRRSYL